MVFCNSIASGVLITGGLFVGDPWLGTCSAISLVSATAMARLASGASPTRANAAARFGAEQHSVRRAAAVDDDMVSNGLASYNGALVGCAFSVFLPGEWVPEIAAASAAGGAVSTILAVSLKNILTMPQCASLLPPLRAPVLLPARLPARPTRLSLRLLAVCSDALLV